MAIINSKFLYYLTSIFEKTYTNNTSAFLFDPLIVLIEYCLEGNNFDEVSLLDFKTFNRTQIAKSKDAFRQRGLAGILSMQFQSGIINENIELTHKLKKSYIKQIKICNILFAI